MHILYNKKIDPILKWPGGKTQELKHIHPLMPKKINTYYEPFVGGGAVYLSTKAQKYCINDKSQELINLYSAVKAESKIFFKTIRKIINSWTLLDKVSEKNSKLLIRIYSDFSDKTIDENQMTVEILSFVKKTELEFLKIIQVSFNICPEYFLNKIKINIIKKIKRMAVIEKAKWKLPEQDIIQNIEASLKSSYYMYIRYLYNNIQKYLIKPEEEIAIFFFIRNFAYSGMFRYNSKGDFNVPYGGIGYNKKNIIKKILTLKNQTLISHLKKTHIQKVDFENFFYSTKPKKNDFIFLDPPYDTDFSTYAKNTFNQDDQKRLASYLISHCKANWLMVIKNTNFILDLYSKNNLTIDSFHKKYLVSFQNRNNKNAEHLIIRNYT